MIERGVTAYGFYNSVNGDRRYSADDFSRYLDGILSDGIMRGYRDQYQVDLNDSNWGLTIRTGKAWFNGTYIISEAAINIPESDIEMPGIASHRRAAVCLQVKTEQRINNVCVIYGNTVPSTDTAPLPTLSRGTDGIWQYPLCYLHLVNGKTPSQVSDAITDTRGTVNCPFSVINYHNFIDDEPAALASGIEYPLSITDKLILYPSMNTRSVSSTNQIISNPFMNSEEAGAPGTPYTSRGFSFRLNGDGDSQQDLIMGVYVPSEGSASWTFGPFNAFSSSDIGHAWSLGNSHAPWYNLYVHAAYGENIGSSTNYWGNGYIDAIYSHHEVMVVSDRELKSNIKDLDERYTDMFMKLRPKSFTYNADDDGTVHTGFIAQEVKEAMDEAGIKPLEFGAYGYNGTNLALRYGEFIALNTKMIQKQQDQIIQLQNEIENLRNEIKTLKGDD